MRLNALKSLDSDEDSEVHGKTLGRLVVGRIGTCHDAEVMARFGGV